MIAAALSNRNGWKLLVFFRGGATVQGVCKRNQTHHVNSVVINSQVPLLIFSTNARAQPAHGGHDPVPVLVVGCCSITGSCSVLARALCLECTRNHRPVRSAGVGVGLETDSVRMARAIHGSSATSRDLWWAKEGLQNGNGQ
jgi:hypothetical protein